MELDWLHFFLYGLILLTAGMVVWWARKVKQHRQRLHSFYFTALVALSNAAKTIDEFAQEEHRTADSMASSGLASMHPAVRNARSRGLEDVRNRYAQRYAEEVRRQLDNYNRDVAALLAEMGEDPDQYRAREV